MGRLDESELAECEEALLVCELCRTGLATAEARIARMRDALRRLPENQE